ncbi:hypothetical protein V8C34DRAFT_72034 [Trichoderma compactum]
MGVQPPGNSTIRPAATHSHTPQKAKPQPPVRRLRCHWRSAGPTRMIRPEGPARRPSLTQMPDAWMPIFREPTLDRRVCKAGNKGIRDGPNGFRTVSLCPGSRLSLFLFLLFFFLSIVRHSLPSLISVLPDHHRSQRAKHFRPSPS